MMAKLIVWWQSVWARLLNWWAAAKRKAAESARVDLKSELAKVIYEQAKSLLPVQQEAPLRETCCMEKRPGGGLCQNRIVLQPGEPVARARCHECGSAENHGH